MSYASVIMESMNKYPELRIIDTKKIYKEKFSYVPEPAFHKAVSRMTKNGDILRIGKGVYCKPKKGRFGTVASSESDILEHYLGKGKNKGVIVGYKMYNRYGLTTQISKTAEVYSKVSLEDKKTVKNVLVQRINLDFNEKTIKMIELLEVLQNYRRIEDLSIHAVKAFIEDSVRYYDNGILKKLMDKIGYKKSTLASLKNVLDFYNIENDISLYLNGTSKYNPLRMEELNDITS